MSNNNENNTSTRLSTGLVPKLRFKEFKDCGEWVETTVTQVADYENGKAQEQDIADDGEFIVVNSKFISQDGEVKKFTNTPFLPATKGDVLMVLSDIPNGKAIAKCFLVEEDNRYTVNQRICRITPRNVNSKILYYLLNRNPYFLAFDDGVKQTNLRKDDVLNCPLLIPEDPNEQQKIAACLSSLDEVITAESQKLELYKQHKKGLLQNLFPQEGDASTGSARVPKLRFKEFEDSGEWEEKKLGEVLEYERPDKYIVKDTNYLTNGTPILTANKSFILGYTNETFGVCNDIPVILFDDFTTDKKFVDFPFKVKSSAIKILRPKGKDDLKFIFELMSLIRFEAKEHKRYYISAYQNLSVPIPKPNEQQKIADCLSSLDDLIQAQTEKIELLKQHKKGLLQGLFPNVNEETA